MAGEEQIFDLTGNTTNAQDALKALDGAVANTSAVLDGLAASVSGMGDMGAQLATLTGAFASSSFDSAAMQSMGFAAKDLSVGMRELIATGDPAAAALAALKSSADGDAVALADLLAATTPVPPVIEQIAVAAAEADLGLSTMASSLKATGTAADEAAVKTDVASASIKKVGTSSSAAGAESAGAMDGLFGSVAGVVNEYMGLLFVVGMVATAIGNMADQGMQEVHQQNLVQGAIGATDSQMQQWGDSIDKINSQFGTMQADSTEAFSTIARAGFQGADAISVLSADEQLAYNTGSKLSDATDILVTSLDAYGASSKHASDFAALLYSAWSSSGLKLSDFNSLMANSLSDAKVLGINFADLTTTVAEFGKTTGNSSIAARDLQGMLSGMENFARLSKGQLAALETTAGHVGVQFDAAKFAAADFAGKLRMMHDALSPADFATYVGGSKNVGEALIIMGQKTQDSATTIKNAHDKIQKAQDKTADDAATAAGRVNAAWSTLMKQLGDSLGPFETGFLNDLANFLDSTVPSKIIASIRPASDAMNTYNRRLLALHQQGLNDMGQQIGLFYGQDLPGIIRQKAPDAYQAELDYLNRLAHPDGSWKAPLRTQITDAFNMQIPSDIRHSAPQAYADELNYLNQLAHPDQGWKNGVRSEVDDTFHKQIPNTITSGIPIAKQAEATYLSSLANPPTNWQKDILLNVDDVYGTSIPAQILNHAPQAYADSLNYIEQQARGVTDGGKTIVSQTKTTYGTDVPAAIRSGVGPSNDAVNSITTAQETAWKKLHTSLVGSSIVPDMMTAIAKAIENGKGPASTSASDVTAAVDKIFAAEGPLAYSDGLAVGNQFAAGITAAQPAAVAAATATAQAVANILAHHSPPKEGPMHDDDKWGGNFMTSFIGGITDNISKLQSASLLAARSVGSNMNMGSSSNTGMGSSNMSMALQQQQISLLRQLVNYHMSSPANSGPQGSVTQNFGNLNFSGINNVNDLYRQLNALSGRSYEDSLRGAVHGSGW